jgi:hypothetical protein
VTPNKRLELSAGAGGIGHVSLRRSGRPPQLNRSVSRLYGQQSEGW